MKTATDLSTTSGARRERPLLVVKLGSSSVTRSSGPDASVLADALEQAAEVMKDGYGVILVTSGAQSLGRAVLSRVSSETDGSADLPAARRASPLQAGKTAAAFGQPILMDFFRAQAELLGIRVSQILVGSSDLRSYERMRALAGVLRDSIAQGLIPIVNGNDPVDNQKTNNDLVAASIAVMTKAAHLVLLTDVPGVFVDDPRNHASRLSVDRIVDVKSTGSGSGTGGIRSKLRAAEATSWSGVVTRIASAKDPNVIRALVAGEQVGTLLEVEGPLATHASDRVRWIAGGATPLGTLTINAEAERSISAAARSSLFASGIKRVKGTFSAGDIVEIRSPGGRLIARGQSAVSGELLRLIRASRVDEIAGTLRAILTIGANEDPHAGSPALRVKEAIDEYMHLSPSTKKEILAEVLTLFPAYSAMSLLGRGASEADEQRLTALVDTLSVVPLEVLVVFGRNLAD